MGFPYYFLIVMEFIQWSKDNGIPVGQARGSGAGSLVAYALDITDLDPLEFDLLLNDSLIRNEYQCLTLISTFVWSVAMKLLIMSRNLWKKCCFANHHFWNHAAKAVIRDVGRVLGHPYGFVDRISKLIPGDPNDTSGLLTLNRVYLKLTLKMRKSKISLIWLEF